MSILDSHSVFILVTCTRHPSPHSPPPSPYFIPVVSCCIIVICIPLLSVESRDGRRCYPSFSFIVPYLFHSCSHILFELCCYNNLHVYYQARIYNISAVSHLKFAAWLTHVIQTALRIKLILHAFETPHPTDVSERLVCTFWICQSLREPRVFLPLTVLSISSTALKRIILYTTVKRRAYFAGRIHD